MIATLSIEYIFLPWNLLLAFVPYFITNWIKRTIGVIENNFKLIMKLFIWLLFIPNSFYIITDLFHLIHVRSAPKWFDLLLIFSFAWNGILAGIISLRQVENIISLVKGRGYAVFMVVLVMCLSGLGIYIGRFLRYNSWDVIMNPLSLAADILDLIMHPFRHEFAWSMTMGYAMFMSLFYFTLKKLSESFIATK
jgi:uncharacterized membrane protein